MTDRAPIAPHILPMIAGAILGELLVFAGLGWFAWQSLANSCVEGGGSVVGMACRDVHGNIEPFAAEWQSPFFVVLMAFALASLVATALFVVRAARRSARPSR